MCRQLGQLDLELWGHLPGYELSGGAWIGLPRDPVRHGDRLLYVRAAHVIPRNFHLGVADAHRKQARPELAMSWLKKCQVWREASALRTAVVRSPEGLRHVRPRRATGNTRGSVLIEFALSGTLFFMVVFGTIEVGLSAPGPGT